MILMVAVGYKTKLVSITLIVALFIHNMRYNNFWRHRNDLFLTSSVHTDPVTLTVTLRMMSLNRSNRIRLQNKSKKVPKHTFSISRNLISFKPYQWSEELSSWLSMDQVDCPLMTVSKLNRRPYYHFLAKNAYVIHTDMASCDAKRVTWHCQRSFEVKPSFCR